MGIQYTGKEDEVSILSMTLRKLNARSIYTSNIQAMKNFMKEQASAKGDFPGSVPIVYWGDNWKVAVENGAELVVISCDGFQNDDIDSVEDVGVIWKTSELSQIKLMIEKGMGNVFLLDNDLLLNDKNGINIEHLEQQFQLECIPESAIVIAALPSMLPENLELTLGRSLSSLGSISSLVFKESCVSDEEDVKYSQFIIDGLTKKSSSTFSMTGLTGSTNGHFGVSSHSGEVKWRRKA